MYNTIIRYKFLVIAILAVVSFLVTYISLVKVDESKYDAKVVQDSLSGEKYNTGGIYNYKDNNPYGSYFVGFDQLMNRGVRNDEWVYISDVLTNFTMYDKKVYNGKISYVKDSFTRDDQKSGSFTTYSYKFGINNSNVYTMKVQSSWVDEVIRISIVNDSSDSVFFREFKIY